MSNTPRAHDDLEAILCRVNLDEDAVTHDVGSAFDATFTWDYGKGQRPALDKLYEKAVIEYEDHVDTSIEYSELNAIERDRAAAASAG